MARVSIGVSFKAYFDRDRAAAWCGEVELGLRTRPVIQDGAVRLFVIPSFPQIPETVRVFEGSPVEVGAQDVSQFLAGPYTGEVTATDLAQHGVKFAEIGHAERRTLLGETDVVVAAKASAAVAAGLIPVLCVGESERSDPANAADAVLQQLAADLAGVSAGSIVIAYEPVWAIGAPEAAPVEHITTVISTVRAALDSDPDRVGSAVIYGGSAGPGLLTRLGADVDGLFLGRFAHDPQAFLAVVDEALALVAGGTT